MESVKLRTLVAEYYPPLKVRREWWDEKQYFRAEEVTSSGRVKGELYIDGIFYQRMYFEPDDIVILLQGQHPVPRKSETKKSADDNQKKSSDAGQTAEEINKTCSAAIVYPPIVQAFNRLPNASKPTASETLETEHEIAYHKVVDNALGKQIDRAANERKIGERELDAAAELWRDEMISARENGYRVDDHTCISIGLREDRARYKINKARDTELHLDCVRQKPYFARIDCGADIDNLHTAYIGSTEIKGYVIDWRNSEIGNAYYHSELYLNRDDVFLALKRLITIEHTIFRGYQNELYRYSEKKTDTNGETISDHYGSDYSVDSDELLTRLLEEARSDKKTHDIIKTIQGQQYDIITADFNQNAVINGCAGSGKTMILYHRLAYMAYNYASVTGKEFDPLNVYIISPSLYFDSSNNELMKQLEIDRVRQAPLDEQVDFFIDKYCAINNLPRFHYLAGMLDSETEASEPVEASMQSYNILIGNFKKINQKRLTYREWVMNFANKLLTQYDFKPIQGEVLSQSHGEILQLLGSADYFHNDILINRNSKGGNRDYYQSSSVTSISYENIMRSLSNRKADSRENTVRLRRIRKNKNFLMACLSLKPRLNSEGEIASEISDFWNLVDNARAFERMLCLILVRKILNCLFLPQNSKEDYILRLLFSAQQQSLNFVSGDIKLCILLFFSVSLGKAIKDESLIFIDEFQNYSAFELACLKSVYSKPVFNLYGDYAQRIEDKGADLSAHIDELLSPNTYNININYRNAKQITAYINRAVHKNMQSIGVNGTVDERSIAACTFALQDRTAIICKDTKPVQHFLDGKVDAKLINDVAVNGALKDGMISLLTVPDCKGLEFETVYVFDSDMSENEKYVAYTRALDHLIVIHDNLKEMLELEEEAKREVEEAARREAEEAGRRRAEEKARLRAEEAARFREKEKARHRAEEMAKAKAEKEAKQKAEECRKETAQRQVIYSGLTYSLGQLVRLKAQENVKRKAEEARRKAEEAKRLAEEERSREKAQRKAMYSQLCYVPRELSRLRAQEERLKKEAARKAEEARWKQVSLLKDRMAKMSESMHKLETENVQLKSYCAELNRRIQSLEKLVEALRGIL